MASRRSDKPEPPVAIQPAPWTTKCETYWLLHWMNDLPPGVYDPLEASSAEFSGEKEAGKFTGGLGMVQIVRYEDTPTGPYDELLLIPGVFKVPGREALRRITRIYVSQRETCYNGRYNWNIPKHLARFEFSHPPNTKGKSLPPALEISVFAPDPKATTPFFSAKLTPMRYLPVMPFSTAWLPLSTGLAQPPLPAAGTAEAEKGEEVALLCATDVWRSMTISATAKRARGMWVDVGTTADASKEEQDEALRWWPRIQPFKIGVWLEDATIVIPAPKEFKL